MALRLLLNLSLLLLVSAAAHAQTAEDFFHGGAMFYLSNNIPSAKQVVTNGLQRFPDDGKLKKLWELLNQQQQSQSQPQQQQEQQQQQQEEKQQDQQKPKESGPDKKPQESKPDEKKPEPQPTEAHAMTEQEAKQLLDAQKGEEQVLQFRPPEKPKDRKVLKDW